MLRLQLLRETVAFEIQGVGVLLLSPAEGFLKD